MSGEEIEESMGKGLTVWNCGVSREEREEGSKERGSEEFVRRGNKGE